MSEGSLSDKVDMLLEKFERLEDDKRFRKLRLSKGKMKKGYVSVIILRTNGAIDIKKLPIHQDMIYLKENDVYHASSSEYIMNYNGNPVMIVPEFSLIPINLKELRKTTEEKGCLSYPQRVIINAVEQSQIKQKGKFNAMTLIIIVIAAIAGIFILSEILK